MIPICMECMESFVNDRVRKAVLESEEGLGEERVAREKRRG